MQWYEIPCLPAHLEQELHVFTVGHCIWNECCLSKGSARKEK